MTADPAGWPDPTRPGVPLNQERGGWHWLHHPEDLRPIPAMWNAELQGWTCGSLHSPGGIVELGYRYLGPCLTPADLAAERAAAAEKMREACATAVAPLPADRRIGDPCQIIRALPIPSASALAEREKEAYRRGWLDRESDFMAGVERTGMAVTDESALAERDERMREEGRREERKP